MKYLISESKLNALVDAYNEVTGETSKLTLDQLATAISEISISSDDLNNVISDGENYDIRSLVTYVKGHTFQGSAKIQNAYFNRATEIGPYAFSDSSLKTLEANACTSLANYACYGCFYLNSVSLPVCTSVGKYALSGSDFITSLSLPDCTSVGANGISGNHTLTSVTLGNASIGANAFSNCIGLTTITFDANSSSVQKSIAYLGDDISSLYSIRFNNYTVVPTLAAGAFSGCTNLAKIYVPSALVDTWKAAANWSDYASKIVGV